MSKTNSLSGIKAIFISAHSDYNAKSRVCCLKFHLIWLVFSFLFFFPLIWLGFKTILPSYILHLHMRLIPLKPGGSLQIWKIYKPDNHSPGTGVTTIYRIWIVVFEWSPFRRASGRLWIILWLPSSLSNVLKTCKLDEKLYLALKHIIYLDCRPRVLATKKCIYSNIFLEAVLCEPWKIPFVYGILHFCKSPYFNSWEEEIW